MKRGFQLLIGSLVALAIAAEVGAQLDSGYNDGRKEFQYLPGGAGGSEEKRKTSVHRGRNGRRLKEGRIHNVPRADPPALPGEFAGEYDGDTGAVPGEPGVDYPIFSFIPVTSFSCEGRIAGYYADPETGCQTFHVCSPGGSPSNSFICPNGTLFNPAIRTCDWWPAVDCGSSSESLKITNDVTKVKSKSETPQLLLRGPDTRVKPQRKSNRGQLQKIRLNPANEALPQVTYRATATPSIVTEGSQYQPFQYTEAPSIQTPQTTSRVPQYTLDSSQKNGVEDYKEQDYVRRRPPGSKRIRNRLPKRPEEPDANVPSRISQYKFGESYRTNPSTIRTTSPTPPVSFSTRRQPITRFDFTSETLDFPSVRNAPSTTTYPTPTAHKNTSYKRFQQRFTTVAPITAPETENHRASFSIEDENKATAEYTSTTTTPYTGRKQFKASKRVNLSPIISRGATNSQQQSVRITPFNDQRISSFDAQNYRQPPLFRAKQEPTRTSEEYTKTTPMSDPIFAVSGTSEKTFNNLVTPTVPILAENEGGIRPIVVASPKPDFKSLRSSGHKKSSPSGFLKVTPPAESFQPISSSSSQSFPQSQSLAHDNNPDDKKHLSSSSVAVSQAQSIAHSQADSIVTQVHNPTVSQAFAKSSAASNNFDQLSVGQSTPLTVNKTLPDEQPPFDIIHTRSSPQPQFSPSGGLNQASRTALPNFSQSFARADAFSSGEGFDQNIPVTTTNSPTLAPKTTTLKPLRPLVSQTTSRPSTTTIRVPYTPTVPQTTARTTTTTSTPRTTVSTTTTTRKPPRVDPKPSTSAPAVISTSTQSIGYPPSKSVRVSSTTKSPKGFYITVAPPTTAVPVQQQSNKDKVPVENSLPNPSSTYLPNSQQYPVKSYSPNFYYQPSRPSIPDSYFRIQPSAESFSYNQYSSTGSVNSHSETKPTPDAPQNPEVPAPPKEITLNNSPKAISTAATVLSTGSGLNSAAYPISDPSFEIKAVPDTFNGSGFELNPLATIEYNPQYFPDYNSPSQKNEDYQTDKNVNFSAPAQADRTTEPSIVIQKSLELFSAHEVAYHPSVFAQTSYSLSTIQDDYLRGSNQDTEFKPPPFLQPSPHARGFGNWNRDDDQKESPFIIS